MNYHKPLLLGGLFLAVLGLFSFSNPAQAASVAVNGYAWSDTIGWIQMNPSPGGVFLDDSTGNLSGYAWSEHIGWVKFDTSSPYPASPSNSSRVENIASCISTGSTCNVTGWARACSGTVNGDCASASRTDGWDGWIKLGPDWTSSVVYNAGTGNFSGYAWGSEVVGWVSFSGVNTSPITQPDLIVQNLSVSGSLTPGTQLSFSGTVTLDSSEGFRIWIEGYVN